MTGFPIRRWVGNGPAALAILLLAACAGQPEPPAAEDRLVLTPVDYSELAGWSADAQAEVVPALRRSCARIESLPSMRVMGADGRAGLAQDWLGPCGALREVPDGDSQAARAYFEVWFQPYRASAGARPDGLFTGYYEASLQGSRHRGGRYQTPLYTRPTGLPLDPSRSGQTYFSRAEIEAGALAGKVPELLWVDDPVDAHILQIQGSGIVHLDDGTSVRVGFDGSNGRRFVALGRILIDHGKLSPDDVTMPTVRAWLEDHPDEAPALMAENPRYVFFRLQDGSGPVGAEGVPLTPGRSLAVDPAFVALGTPLWLLTVDPDGVPIRRLMIAQDVGSAIKGPVRGDIFWGSGDDAFDKAGRMKSRGEAVLLLPRWHSAPVAMDAF